MSFRVVDRSVAVASHQRVNLLQDLLNQLLIRPAHAATVAAAAVTTVIFIADEETFNVESWNARYGSALAKAVVSPAAVARVSKIAVVLHPPGPTAAAFSGNGVSPSAAVFDNLVNSGWNRIMAARLRSG